MRRVSWLFVLVWLAGAAPWPVAASPAEAVRVQVAGELDAVSDALKIEKLMNMDLRRVLALTLGVAVGIAVSEAILPGQFRFIGMVGGALIGEYWYRKRHFPFN